MYSGLTLQGDDGEGRIWITLSEPRSLTLALHAAAPPPLPLHPGLVGAAGSACTECTNSSGCPDVAPTGCGDSAPYCVKHGSDCVCKSTNIGTSGHAYYNAEPDAPRTFAEMEYTVEWTQMPLTGSNCYASMMMYWDGAGGYMGSQFHSDGNQVSAHCLP